MNRLKLTLSCCLAGMLALSASVPLAAGGEETAEQRTRREALQKKWTELPVVQVGTALQDVRFTTVALDKSKVQLGKEMYYAIRFKVPESAGNFLWAWRSELTDQRFSWGILASQGTTDAGFTESDHKRLQKDVKDLGKKGSPFVVQWLDRGQLTPGGDYILWFHFEKAGAFAKPTVVCSLNVIPGGADMRWKDVFPMFYE
jgi:hypothetical protein